MFVHLQVISVPYTLDQLINEIIKKFSLKTDNPKVCKLHNKDGGEVDDIRLIRDNDVLYLTEYKPISKPSYGEDWITLNVGGRHFTTSKSTLTTKEPNSMLARMFAEEGHGYLFTPSNIDSSGCLSD